MTLSFDILLTVFSIVQKKKSIPQKFLNTSVVFLYEKHFLSLEFNLEILYLIFFLIFWIYTTRAFKMMQFIFIHFYLLQLMIIRSLILLSILWFYKMPFFSVNSFLYWITSAHFTLQEICIFFYLKRMIIKFRINWISVFFKLLLLKHQTFDFKFLLASNFR